MFRRLHVKKDSGFTLLEVTFVITIFAVMASIVLFRFKDFGSKSSLDNLVQDIALRVVEAQKQAISGVLNVSLLGTDAPVYGVYFSDGSTAVDDDDSHKFVYFTDLNGNRVYDPGVGCSAVPTSGHECLSSTNITTGEYVSNICSIVSGTYSCSAAPGTSAHITFKRPFPDATLYVCPTASCASSPSLASMIYLEVTSGADPTTRETIIVTDLGETSVYNGCVAKAHDHSASCT